MNVQECTHKIIPRTKSELNRCAQNIGGPEIMGSH